MALTSKSHDFDNVVSLNVMIEDLLLLVSDADLLFSAHRESEVNKPEAAIDICA